MPAYGAELTSKARIEPVVTAGAAPRDQGSGRPDERIDQMTAVPTSPLGPLAYGSRAPARGRLLGAKTIVVLTIIGTLFALWVLVMVFPIGVGTLIMDPVFSFHDRVILPLKGRFWLEHYPSSLVGASALGFAMVVLLSMQRKWSKLHFAVASEVYSQSHWIRRAMWWIRRWNGRSPGRYALAILDYNADTASNAANATHRVLAPVQVRSDLAAAGKPEGLFEAAARVAMATMTLPMPSKLLADRATELLHQLQVQRSSTDDWPAGTDFEVPCDACIWAIHMATLPDGPQRALEDETIEQGLIDRATARIDQLHNAASVGRDGRDIWPDLGYCARTLCQALSVTGRSYLINAWHEAETRARYASDMQFATVRAGGEEPLLPEKFARWHDVVSALGDPSSQHRTAGLSAPTGAVASDVKRQIYPEPESRG